MQNPRRVSLIAIAGSNTVSSVVHAMHIMQSNHKNADYTQLRNNQQYHVYARSADLVHTKKAQGKKRKLIVYYDH